MKPNVLALVVAWLGAAVAVGAAVSTRRYIRAVDRTMALAFARLQRERAGRWHTGGVIHTPMAVDYRIGEPAHEVISPLQAHRMMRELQLLARARN